MEAISISCLKKTYGKTIGIEDVSFDVKTGEIMGFVGPNGAGKSTTIKVLLNFILKDSGEASIMGIPCEDGTRIKAFTGYVPADVRLYERLSVQRLLQLNAAFLKTDMNETNRLLKVFDLEERKVFSTLSTGNKKKVSLIMAMANRPQVLLLDEPTSGLDPMAQKTLFEELKAQTADGAAILLSSHNLAEVQEYCHRVAFIKNGKILSQVDLKNGYRPQKIVMVKNADGQTDTFTFDGESKALLSKLQALSPVDFTVREESMEERFMHLYEKENAQ